MPPSAALHLVATLITPSTPPRLDLKSDVTLLHSRNKLPRNQHHQGGMQGHYWLPHSHLVFVRASIK